MAALYDVESTIEEARRNEESPIRAVAETLIRRLPPIELIALASFLPGLADYRSDTFRIKAVKSVKFLIRLATFLKRAYPRLRTIELVGGSLIYRITRGSDESGVIYTARCLDPVEAIQQLIRSLREVSPLAQAAGIQLALEYEPGPLYVLGVQKRIEDFCKGVDESGDPILQSVVGLNLDIAHWGFLSKFGSKQEACIRNKVIHAHVSSHGRGHFGDAPVELTGADCLQLLTDFHPWFWLLKGLNGDPSHLRFSGFVSLELEACKTPTMVEESLRNLRSIPGTV